MNHRYDNGFTFDMNRLGWATSQKPDNAFTVEVDVVAEEDQNPHKPEDNDKNKHRVAIEFAKCCS